jgi:hypothetical protein
VLPIALDDAYRKMTSGWRSDVAQLNIGDFKEWEDQQQSYEQALRALVESLKR